MENNTEKKIDLEKMFEKMHKQAREQAERNRKIQEHYFGKENQYLGEGRY
ncbi:hypothetical protein [Paenibacillus woosongensis]|uniref:Uncharacterized protein n=1 Tax=Paenibacillus woosongensis TaxID=307580 RepID=A0ABQ4MXE5_9BACL|nr:hypothetical protein [Paenibacillus woosongensis]GIP60589.1 hypothetical protein J15TS10_44030 [Paenibacillus woosongensis]